MCDSLCKNPERLFGGSRHCKPYRENVVFDLFSKSKSKQVIHKVKNPLPWIFQKYFNVFAGEEGMPLWVNAHFKVRVDFTDFFFEKKIKDHAEERCQYFYYISGIRWSWKINDMPVYCINIYSGVEIFL